MDYAEFVADLPSDHLSFSCVEENEEVLERYGVTSEARQLGSGRYRSALAATDIDGAKLYSHRFDTAVSRCYQLPRREVAMLFTRSAQGAYRANGSDVSRGGFLFIPYGCDVEDAATGLSGGDALVIPEDRFDSSFKTLFPDVDLPETTTVLAADNRQTKRLQAEIVTQLNDPVPEPGRVIDLTEATIAFMAESLRSGQLVPPNVLCRRRIAKQAKAFIEAHYADPIHIDDICRATGVGVRTLQRAFRDYFDVTITEYIKTVRLDRVFRALNAAHPCEATITDIALDHGFAHLGRFSVMYGDRFGESPSTTLNAPLTVSHVG